MELFIGALKYFTFGSRKFCAWVVHVHIRRTWGFNKSSQNALRFEIKEVQLATIVKMVNLKISCFYHVMRDSRAPKPRKRRFRKICAWVVHVHIRGVCSQKIATKASQMFEIKAIQLATFRNRFCWGYCWKLRSLRSWSPKALQRDWRKTWTLENFRDL